MTTDGPTPEPERAGRSRHLRGPLGVVQKVVLSAIPLGGFAFLLGASDYLGIAIYQEQWVGLLLSLFFVGGFLTFPAVRTPEQLSRLPWYDGLLALLGCVPGGYLAVLYPDIVITLGVPSPTRTALSILTVLLAAELLRRIVGWSLVVVLAVFVLYGLTADSFPGVLQGQPVSPERLLNYVYVDPSAILGMLALGATFGVAFIAFGQVLLHYGAGDSMTDLALIGFGRFRGGSSKAAVVASSLAGTVSGGAMSNVLLTGTVTIPLMIRGGYRRSVAAAIEALASSGGQVMPPVMGIAAFLIAENLGVPYGEIALAAIIPAVLLYATLFLTTDLEAGRKGLRAMTRAQLPSGRRTMQRGWVLIPTLGALIYALFVAGMEPARAAATVALLSIPVMLLLPSNRRNLWRGFATLLTDTGRVILDLAAVLVAAGVVVGVVSITGVGFQFAYGALELAGGNVFVILIMAALASIVLGMGMPSVAAYALVAVLLVPALVEGGINPLAAHMFVFYFSVLSNITPPIAVAVFAAATLAGSPQMRSAVEAMRLGWSFFLIPFLFVISPALLLQGGGWTIALVAVTAALGVSFVSVGLMGYLRGRLATLPRAVLVLSGAALLYPADGSNGLLINGVGALVGALMLVREVLSGPGGTGAAPVEPEPADPERAEPGHARPEHAESEHGAAEGDVVVTPPRSSEPAAGAGTP